MTTREATARSGADSAAGKIALSPTPRAYFAADAIGAAIRKTPTSRARLRARARTRAGERIGERGPCSERGHYELSAGTRRLLRTERAAAPKVTGAQSQSSKTCWGPAAPPR